MKRKQTAGQATPNNNIDINYYLINHYSVEKKLDFITLSVFSDQHEKVIYSFLEANGFKLISNHILLKGNYYIKRTYKSDTDIASVEIKHGVKKRFYPSLLIKIHDANKEFLALLDSFFNYHRIKITVSEIEMTFDFFTDSPSELFHFLNSHLLLKNARTKPYSGYPTTLYANDTRKSTKGMRVYLKKFEGEEKVRVRMELVLKRSIIRKLGLDFPLSNIDSVDLSKFFSFKDINFKKMKEYLYWKHRKQIAALEEKGKVFGKLIKQQLNNYVRCSEGEESFMGQSAVLKSKECGIKNHSRFIEPLDWFTADFLKKAATDHFIKSKPVLKHAARIGPRNTLISLMNASRSRLLKYHSRKQGEIEQKMISCSNVWTL